MNFIINVIFQTIRLRFLLTVSIHLHFPWENVFFIRPLILVTNGTEFVIKTVKRKNTEILTILCECLRSLPSIFFVFFPQKFTVT